MLRLLAALALLASPEGHFDRQTLSVDGRLLQVSAFDLDGDGLQDLLAASATPDGARHYSVFWNQGGAFHPRPDLVFASDITACAFDIAPPETKGGAAELLELTPRGVRARSLGGRAPGAARSLLEQPTFCRAAEPGELLRLGLVQALSGPGGAELLVPGLGSLSVYARRGGRAVRTAELEAPFQAHYRARTEPGPHSGDNLPALEATLTLPAVHLADLDGDGRTDLLLTRDDTLVAYLQGPGLAFAAEPALRRSFAIRTEEERRSDKGQVTIQVADLDRDGLADVLVRKETFKGITSAANTLWLFRGRPGGRLPEAPDQVIDSEGVAAGVQLRDVSGDGRPDLLLPSVDLGVVALVRMLTTRTARVHLRAYPFEGGRFAARPTLERDLAFELSLSGEADLQAVELGGDYDGDGRPDLALGTSPQELCIYRGVAGGAGFEEEPAERLELPARGHSLAADLSGRGRSDLVLYAPATTGHQHELTLLLNRGGW